VNASVLEGATIVHHDSAEARSIAMTAGLVTAEAAPNAVRIDLRDHLIFPGLINVHDHLQLNSIPSLPHDAPFPNSYAWIDAYQAHFRRADVALAVRVPSDTRHWVGGLKNLLAGVTTVAHHDPWQAVLDDPDFPVHVLRGAGWSHSLGFGEARDDHPPQYGPDVRESFCATPTDEPWIIHLAEGTDEVAAAELGRLDALGCLAQNTVLVHGVGLSSEDVDRVIERGAAVVWCPASNLATLGRTLDPRRLFDAGRLALGSDSRLSGSRDVLDELRVAAAHSDLSSRELLRLITEDASRVLRRPEIGGLHPGQGADCIIVRGDGDPYEALLRINRTALRAVVRAGVPVIADPDFAHWFAGCGVATIPVRIDGRPKLMAERFARSGAMDLEPGLEIL
jgi:cytosine/adenosine deaminase-related metal-dependent hydrolase